MRAILMCVLEKLKYSYERNSVHIMTCFPHCVMRKMMCNWTIYCIHFTSYAGQFIEKNVKGS
jgi:hypothetical protein